jgi:hypothetical protein
METATLEKPRERRARTQKDEGVYSTLGNSEWIKLMAESLKGVPDKELSDKYGVNVNTIRQRRYNDGAWRIAYDRLKESALVEGKKAVETVKTAPLSIAEITALSPELLANYLYNALKCSVEQGLLPLPSSWSEAKTAMDMLWKATGQDKPQTNVQLNLWSGSSASPAPSIAAEVEIVSQEAQNDWI